MGPQGQDLQRRRCYFKVTSANVKKYDSELATLMRPLRLVFVGFKDKDT